MIPYPTTVDSAPHYHGGSLIDTFIHSLAASLGWHAGTDEDEPMIPYPGVDASDWRADALCAETDPEIFFPDKGESVRPARRICGLCAVRAECLEDALAHDERHGMWGGKTAQQRRKLRHDRAHRLDTSGMTETQILSGVNTASVTTHGDLSDRKAA